MDLNKNNSHFGYRPDIDGLRAVAVLLVIIFHAFPNIISGGYVGVDIFFVISGFLITTIIQKSLNVGKFTIKDFYARRIIRIFPALILTLLVCWLFGWFALLPLEYARLGTQMLSGAAFFSNFLFWLQGGYFDIESIKKPLLHLWSLGVEEQFYIFYPLLLIIAWRKSYKIFWILIVLICLSFSLNFFLSIGDQIIIKFGSIDFVLSNTFYSPFTRFWELILGGVLAIHNSPQRFVSEKFTAVLKIKSHDLISVSGLLLITGFLLFYPNNYDAQIGAWMLLPTLGAYLIISAGPAGVINRKILSARFFVWVGKISYPLYLWHWPLLSFIHITDSRNNSSWLRLTLVLISILLAWLTFRFVEIPFRTIKDRGAAGVDIMLKYDVRGCNCCIHHS